MSGNGASEQRHVIVVGGGFGGVGCARRLAGRDDVRVTLVDRNNYHQFQPLRDNDPGRGFDQRKMSEGLGEVPEMMAGRDVELLGV